MSILIVDDEENIRESLREILLMAGYNVLTAGSGKEALECVKRENGSINLMLVDLSMPGMTGEELIRSLRKQKRMLPVLVITALAPWQTVGLLTEMGVGYLRKPIDCDLLLGTIKTYMKKEGGNGCKNAC